MERKKALCLASVASNLDNFNRSNVDLLLDLGYEVTLASNFDSDEDINSKEKIAAFRREMESRGVQTRQIDFSRRLSRVKDQIDSVRQVKKLIGEGFDLIHCHSPICAAITRFSARKARKKQGTKVIYTAHGFHFYNGAPLQNWLLFYPVEKALSRYTDVLITINQEDYRRAKKHFHAVHTEYIHGIGINTEKFHGEAANPAAKRRELGLTEEDMMLLSVGELNENKNHSLVIKALAEIGNPNMHYVIAGIGHLENELKQLASDLGLSSKVHFLGYRTDIADLCRASDLFVFPSFREGLSVALMEAIACETPVLCSRIRGNEDLVHTDTAFFDPKDQSSLVCCIRRAVGSRTREERKVNLADEVRENRENLVLFEKKNVDQEMRRLYERAGETGR